MKSGGECSVSGVNSLACTTRSTLPNGDWTRSEGPAFVNEPHAISIHGLSIHRDSVRGFTIPSLFSQNAVVTIRSRADGGVFLDTMGATEERKFFFGRDSARGVADTMGVSIGMYGAAAEVGKGRSPRPKQHDFSHQNRGVLTVLGAILATVAASLAVPALRLAPATGLTLTVEGEKPGA